MLAQAFLSTRGSHAASWLVSPLKPTLSLDGKYLVAARRREPGAFEALVKRHQTPLFNFCLRMLGHSDDAADVAQETFVQLYSHLIDSTSASRWRRGCFGSPAIGVST